MGSIKDRNVMDLTEAEDIKKRWQEYTEEVYKKDLHDQDNHDGVIIHQEPELKRRFGSPPPSGILVILRNLPVHTVLDKWYNFVFSRTILVRHS